MGPGLDNKCGFIYRMNLERDETDGTQYSNINIKKTFFEISNNICFQGKLLVSQDLWTVGKLCSKYHHPFGHCILPQHESLQVLPTQVLLNLICTVKEPKFALYETVSTTLDVKLHCSYTGFINNLKFFLNVASNIPSQDLVNCKKGSLVHGLYFLLSFSVMKSIRFDSYLIAFQNTNLSLIITNKKYLSQYLFF